VEADGSGEFATLAEAVEAAPAGAALSLGVGTFRLEEPLDLPRSIQLLGTGPDQTEILSAAGEHVLRYSGEGLFAAQGITFRHEGDAAADVVVVEGGEIALENCRFTGASRGAGKAPHAGLRLAGDTTGVVENCQAVDNQDTGILVQDQAQPTLRGNVCSGNAGVGIGYLNSSGGTASGNTCTENGLGGFVIAGQARPLLEQNTSSNNAEAGFAYFEQGGGTARENVCEENGRFGIFLFEEVSPELVDNDCSIDD
jgi:parallel beta-helix repeat protein